LLSLTFLLLGLISRWFERLLAIIQSCSTTSSFDGLFMVKQVTWIQRKRL